MPHPAVVTATPVAIFDFDGTLVGARVWRSLTGYQIRHRINLLPALAYPGLHYPLYPPARVGLIGRETFIRVWAEHMPWLVYRMPIAGAERLFDGVVRERLLPAVRPTVLDELRARQREGYEVVLLSGSLEPLISAFGRAIGVRHAVGTRLEKRDGRYTGRGLAPLCYGKGKDICLRRYLDEQGIAPDWARSCAYGDTIADAAILSLVGTPVAVAPSDELRAQALRSGWRIIE